MITTEVRYLSDSEIKSIEDFIAKNDRIVGEKFEVYTLIGLLLIDFLILFLIFLFEDYTFSIIFKFLWIVPIWAILMITFRYFQKRITAKRYVKFYTEILKSKEYEMIRVRPTDCDFYSKGHIDYYLFDSKDNSDDVWLMIKLNDFSVDRDKFPSDDFYISPYYLHPFIGNEIIIQGQPIKAKTENKRIKKYLHLAEYYKPGDVMILDRSNNA